MTVQQAISKMADYMNQNGGNTPSWYAGVAADPNDRLFVDHNVQESGDLWIHAPLSTDDEARQVEKHFLDQGCQGGSGGGNWQTRHAYAYKVKSHTLQ